MEDIYPAGPTAVPEKLTKPGSSYRRHAWYAMGGLLMFVLLYMALAGWFVWSGYRVINLALVGGHYALIYWVVGASCVFLAIFMLKALFFVRSGGEINDVEVTEPEEPKLFAFLYRLADEVGAPRPHRVFLSPRVNAAVFYDLSLLNLIFPSRKNLEIGLALVNVLTLSELKAVLAHEFGHFGQKSMAVGRWVYVAQQIAAHIITKRDALDKFLRFLSRIDLRVAWIGWLLSLVVWSLRSLLETAFSLVVMAQRALSREMEFQADLVAVSTTGSDALIHALHRLQAADEAWERAQSFVNSELNQGHATENIFAVQTRILQHLANIFNDTNYGDVPDLPEQQPEKHRLFKAEVAQPPRMWATHPYNHEREENAKRIYLAAPLDQRSAWEVFQDPDSVKIKATQHLLSRFETTPKAMHESMQFLDKQYDQEYLKSVYRGAYMARSVVRHAHHVDHLYSNDVDSAITDLEHLYPESLSQDLEQLRNVEREKSLLEALRDGFYKAPGGVIRFRGKELQLRELPHAIEELRAESEVLQNTISDHDRRCRTAHRAAAALLQHGWEEYLAGLLKVLHYADHSEANLLDSQRYLANVVAVITADRNVSSRELKRLIRAGQDVYEVLTAIYIQSDLVVLDASLKQHLEVDSWAEGLGQFNFPAPDKQNINEWMNAIDSWINSTANALSILRRTTLEQLLVSEAEVAKCVRDNIVPTNAPEPSTVPEQYATLTPGSERELQRRLGLWDRFQTADGFYPALFRFTVAMTIIGAFLFFSATVDLWRY